MVSTICSCSRDRSIHPNALLDGAGGPSRRASADGSVAEADMKNKIAAVILCAMLLALGTSAAQQPPKIPRIGVLSTAGDSRIPGFQIEAFRKGLVEIGYIDGKTVLVDYRYAEGNQDRLPAIVAELLQLK